MPIMTPARPWMDPELELLRDTARRFFDTECAPRHEEWVAQKHVDRKIWRRAGELGLFSKLYVSHRKIPIITFVARSCE